MFVLFNQVLDEAKQNEDPGVLRPTSKPWRPLSFVRSIQMDSWTEKQIAAMEKSGGNQKFIDFCEARGITKSLKIPVKYNTKQAAYYKERLSRLLEGKTEPPPDPGRFDPATGVSEAQGAEPLPGETTEQYNERQAPSIGFGVVVLQSYVECSYRKYI